MPYKNTEKQKKYLKTHYKENKQDYLDRSTQRRRVLVAWYWELKSKYYCLSCGEDHPACIDFHHRNPKEKFKTISAMVTWMHTKADILKEIEKCDPLCANCHRKFHYGKQGP